MNKTKWFTVGAVGIVIALLLLVKGGVGGTTNFDTLGLSEGLTVGSTLDVTATTTLTGQLNANAATNKFGSAASSTIQIGATLKAGCIILGDSSDAAAVVYIVASGTTITAATTTKPAACQTAQ